MGEIKQSLEIGHVGNWVRVSAIYDTGATTSYLKEYYAKKINAIPIQNVTTILGDGRKVKGWISQINVKIGNRIGLVDVIVVPNLDGELLIGQDFMQKNDIKLDMRREKLLFGTGQPKLKKIYRL